MTISISQVDVLLTPVACGPPPLYSDLSKGGFQREDADDFYTQPVNLAGTVDQGVFDGGEQLIGCDWEYGSSKGRNFSVFSHVVEEDRESE